MTPRNLDDARRLMPGLGFTVYAMEPGAPVTLEIIDPEVSDQVPLQWQAPSELEAWEKAFPAEPIASAVDALFGPEGLPFDPPTDPTAGLAAELTAELAEPPAPNLFD